MAEALIKAMGGKGGIVALGGIQSNVPAIERKTGLDAGARGQPGRQAARLPGRQLVGDRGAGEDQRLAHPVRRRDHRHLGGQRRHGARRASRRCAPTAAPARCRSPASTASSSRSRRSWTARWPAPSPGIRIWQGGMGLSIGYHAKTGKFDPSKEPKEHREFYGTGVPITERERAGVLRRATSRREPQARLERHLGPRQRADPVQLTGRGRARAAARPPSRRRNHRLEHSRNRRARGAAALAARRLGAARRAGGALRHHRADQPNFLTFGNFVRISQAAMIPLVLGLGATFIILMGSIDLSVEGVLTLGRGDPRRCSCSTAPTATISASSASSSCWRSAPLIGFVNGVDPRQAAASRPSWRRSACGSSASASPTRSSAASPSASTTR